jgi:DNA (cytosine-5)-methyltransferase 1
LNTVRQLGNILPTRTRENPNQGRVYDPDGIAPTLHCKGGGNLEPHIIIGSTQKNAYVGNGDISPTLTEAMGKGGGQIPMVGTENNMSIRIRKLTPKECFRLMGFDDADIDLLVEHGISNTQLYKMAGNSIVVTVLEYLFCQIFDSENEIWV